MPTYEYECQKCGKVFELVQSMSEPPRKRCIDKNCKGKVNRLIGAGGGLIFKGSGFYITDYKKKSGGESAEKAESSSSSESSSTKTESKTESKSTKSESKPAKKGANVKGSD